MQSIDSNCSIFKMNRKSAAVITIALAIGCPLLGEIQIDSSNPSSVPDKTYVGVETAQISILPNGYVPSTELQSNLTAPTRSYWTLNTQELKQLPAFPENQNAAVLSQGKSGFDLWNAVESTSAPPGSAIMLSFSFRLKTDMKLILGIGCTGETFIYLNGEIIHATRASGFHEFMRCQNLVRLNAVAGENTLKIICRKGPWSEIPILHHQDQWLVSLDIYNNDSAAWAACRSRNFNLTDTPVVATPADLRVDAATTDQLQASLYDIEGTEVTQGIVGDNGSIKWASDVKQFPFVGFLRLGSTDADPVIFTGPDTIESSCTKLFAMNTIHAGTDAWKKRCDHLLKHEFVAIRNYWWARKLALGMAMCFANEQLIQVRELTMECKSADIRFHQYTSEIDGTDQYYRMFRPHNVGKKTNFPVVVVLPAVENFVNPHLESADVADLHDAEVLASLADEYKITVVWPGIVDVDHGGNLARREIQECLNSVESEFGDRPLQFYLLGSCSSGLMALGYAETAGVSGLILQSPIVSRWNSQWIAGLPLDRMDYPVTALKPEDPNTALERLKGTQVYVVFNNDMPGHGDRPGTHALCDKLTDLGISLYQRWPTPEHFYTWGERARIQLEPMFQWISSKAGNESASRSMLSKKGPTEPISVKSLMLEGFVVPRSDDPRWSAW